MATRNRPRDLNQLAKRIVDISTGDIEDSDPDAGKDPKAVERGRLGGMKGGLARKKRLSKAERKAIAKSAAKARWSKSREIELRRKELDEDLRALTRVQKMLEQSKNGVVQTHLPLENEATMDDPFQQQALGRANAACAALFALYERMEGDVQLAALLESHAELARSSLLHTSTPEIALSEFDKTIHEFQHRISKTP